jgi:hypothetical protein
MRILADGVYPAMKLIVEIRTMPLAIANHGRLAGKHGPATRVALLFIRNLRSGAVAAD